MPNTNTIDCGYNGSMLTLGPKILQSFDSCKLKEGWIKVGVGVHPNVQKYEALKNGAKAVLRLFNTKNPEIIKFRKGATVKLSTRIIQYPEKFRIKK